MATAKKSVSWAMRAALAQRSAARQGSNVSPLSLSTLSVSHRPLHGYLPVEKASLPAPCAAYNSLQDPIPPGLLTRTSNSYTHLLDRIATHLRSHSTPDIHHLTHLLRQYESDPRHWQPWAFADPGKDYTRNLVAEIPGIFNLMLLVWTPGRASPVHDHAQSHCLMKVLQGRIRETRYAHPRGQSASSTTMPMHVVSRQDFAENQISFMSDDLGLHSVGNPHLTRYAVSMHLYTPPNAALRGCHVYDVSNGGARHVLQGAYDSVRGVARIG